jgi:hypothetical protein
VRGFVLRGFSVGSLGVLLGLPESRLSQIGGPVPFLLRHAHVAFVVGGWLLLLMMVIDLMRLIPALSYWLVSKFEVKGLFLISGTMAYCFRRGLK